MGSCDNISLDCVDLHFRTVSMSRSLSKDLDKLGLKQIEFADLLGFQRETISRWVNGHDAVPKYAQLIIKLLLEKQENQELLIQMAATIATIPKM